MTPDFLKLFYAKRLRFPEHETIIPNMLAAIAATDKFGELKEYYDNQKAEYLASLKIEEVKEDLVETAGEDKVLTKEELLEKKKTELVEICETLGLDTDGNKPDLADRILSHQSNE